MSFTQHEKQGLVYHTADHFPSHALLHGFSSRLGGVSEGVLDSLNLGRSRGDTPAHVRENYQRFENALGGSLSSLVMCQQVHSDRVVTVTQEHALPDLYAPTPFEADGLVTNVPGLALTVFYADCIPVLLYDPSGQVIAAVHSGWRGTAGGIAGKAVLRMQEDFSSHPSDILAAIGPGICERCFETHEDVPSAMRETLGSHAQPFISPLPSGKFQVDLKGMIVQTLLGCGLLPENIARLDLCTACHPELYWSHRRLGDQRGNQAAVISLRHPST